MLTAFQYETKGTCAKVIKIVLNDRTIRDIEFVGGCPGGLMAIASMCRNKEIDEVMLKLEGIECGSKGTSCANELVKALLQADINIKQRSKNNE